MKRNRLDSASLTTAVGCACMQLFFAVVGVGFSLTKVIYGAEFIDACPSKDILPVYVVISGCLPILLTPLKQEYDYEARCEGKLKLFTAVIAVLANLTWLMAGTFWLGQALKESNFGFKECCNVAFDDSCTPLNTTDFNITLAVNESIIFNNGVFYTTGSNIDNSTGSNETQDGDVSSSPPIVFDHFPADYFDEVTCFDCKKHMLGFCTVVVVVDWVLFVIGSVYLCSFCCRRVLVIKDQLLVINA